MKYKKVTYSKFIKAISRMPEKLTLFLTKYTIQEYTELGAVTYLSEDRSSGYAITKDKHLISVFSLPGARQGDSAMEMPLKTAQKHSTVLMVFFLNFISNMALLSTKD